MTTQAGGSAFLHELELNVSTELTQAGTGQPGGAPAGVPDGEQLPDPDAQRYEIGLRALLGAVEALEHGENDS
jgi:hypothetical protein